MVNITLSDANKRQNDALSRFNAWLLDQRKHILRGAEIYAECIREGVDMTERLDARWRNLFENINRGRLLPDVAEKLVGNPKMVATISAIPTSQQKQLLEDGVEVWRNGRAQRVPLAEVQASEAIRLIDRTGGHARLLSAEEQKDRDQPRKPKHDKIVQLRLTPEQYEQVARVAKARGRSIPMVVHGALFEVGILSSGR